MRTIIVILLMATTSCAVAKREKRLNEFKELTKDICTENRHEVELAQILYVKYVKE
jgi:hypothetical protein